MPWSVLQKKPKNLDYTPWNCRQTNPHSRKMADGMIILPGDSKGNNEEKHSIQPMGSQFEQMSFLIFDAIVIKTYGKLESDIGADVYAACRFRIMISMR